MRIAVPVSGGRATDLNHCEGVAMMDVDPINRAVAATVVETPPEYQSDKLTQWVYEHGANVLIASDVGLQAQSSLAQSGIEVLIGAPAQDATELADPARNQGLGASSWSARRRVRSNGVEQDGCRRRTGAGF